MNEQQKAIDHTKMSMSTMCYHDTGKHWSPRSFTALESLNLSTFILLRSKNGVRITVVPHVDEYWKFMTWTRSINV